MIEPGRSIGDIFLRLLIVGLAVGSYILGILAGAADGSQRARLIAVGGGFLAASIIGEAVRQRSFTSSEQQRVEELEEELERRGLDVEKLEQEYEARLVVALADVMTPVAELVATIVVSPDPEKTRLKGVLQQTVVTAAAKLCGPDGETRAVFFALHGNELRHAAYAGRSDAPTTVFVNGRDRKGTAAHKLVAEKGLVFVRDTTKENRVGLTVPAGTRYRTYLAVAVYAGNRPLGMLAVDALRPGSIKQVAVGAAKALAQTLAIGMV